MGRIWFGVSKSEVATSNPLQSALGFPPVHAAHESVPVWVTPPMIGFVGLRAILNPAATATGGVVVPVLDVSEDSEFSSPTCSKEDPGVPDGDPSFPLSVEDQPVRGSDYVLEEAWYWV
jgi:hypothetical protein